MPKFFSQQIDGDTVTLDKDDSKHIKTVLRAEKGDKITVCDCMGTDYRCEVISLDENVKAKILEKIHCESEPKTKITLFQGLPKSDKMEFIIQKCVEIGVCRIVPVRNERSIAKIDNKETKKTERWQKISLSAAKQSGRGIIPNIGMPLSFKEAVAAAKEMDLAVIPYENEQDTGLKAVLKNFSGNSVAVFIGPEGGFSESEISFAVEKGVVPVTLGKRILRTETAGPVAAAIILYELEG